MHLAQAFTRFGVPFTIARILCTFGFHRRFDRRWEAPPGSSLLVSVLVRPLPDGEDPHRLVMATALTAVAAFAIHATRLFLFDRQLSR
jgi:hypothetical protein